MLSSMCSFRLLTQVITRLLAEPPRLFLRMRVSLESLNGTNGSLCASVLITYSLGVVFRTHLRTQKILRTKSLRKLYARVHCTLRTKMKLRTKYFIYLQISFNFIIYCYFSSQYNQIIFKYQKFNNFT
ncbi:Hypothetical_protein [Hexamita inflata]|uniref:Hypothetical_protein n=1 Tax=Hexamita inflata TaxID=28002 RepID=A0AA86PNG9_9EUKA|nr:Hypothetical protein HINF_LOCUS29471 [Hexamita inflata]